MFHEFEDILPYEWTPVGNKGVQYLVEDLELTYMKDEYIRWGAEIYFRNSRIRYLDRVYPVHSLRWERKEIQKLIWGYLYAYEAIVDAYDRLNQGRLRDQVG